MKQLYTFIESNGWEIVYQLSIVFVLFLFFAYTQDMTIEPNLSILFQASNLAFFANYLLATIIINYVLLPKFYYRKRLWAFFLATAVLITLIILIDELILEQVYYPETRGTYFPGIPFTLLETLPIIIIMVSFKFAWDFIRKQKELDHLKSLVKESEIQHLKSQINPHFLFNSLNNVYSFAIDQSPDTPKIILELSSVLRYMLYECQENFVSIQKEIKHLEDYTALNQHQIGNRGSVTFTHQCHSGNFVLPPLLLSVFIENAFKHSTSTLSRGIEIVIQLALNHEGKLSFECTNNYSSANMGSIKSASGIGLENVRKRLNLLYPKTHHLEMSEGNGKFHVNLSMDLKSIPDA